MFNIEVNLDIWYADEVNLSPSNTVNVNNFVWNKILRRDIINFLEEECEQNYKWIVQAIKNKDFSMFTLFEEEAFKGGPIVKGTEFQGYKYVDCDGYFVLFDLLTNDEKLIDKVHRIYYKDEFEKGEEVDEYCTYSFFVEDLSYFFSVIDDEHKVTLSNKDHYILKYVYYFLEQAFSYTYIEKYIDKNQIQNEEDLRRVTIEYLRESGVPKNIAQAYANQIIENNKEFLRIEKDLDLIELLQESIYDLIFEVLEGRINPGDYTEILKYLYAKENNNFTKIIPFPSKIDKIYPNDPCPCGSGKKYKKCCKK